MKSMIVVTLGAVAACATTPHPGRPDVGRAEQAASETGFRMLGLDESGVPDEIDVLPIDGNRPLRELMVIVERGPAKLRAVEVNLDGGDAFVARTRSVFATDSASRIIEIPHGPRTVDHIHLSYQPLNSEMDPVRVEVWGR